MEHRIYVASGWFTTEQEEARLTLIRALKTNNMQYYSPKDDFLYIPLETSSKDVFKRNLIEINRSTLVIASTVGKDMGTLFECGYAYAEGIPIVYYYPHKSTFNLMLAESARAILTNPSLLIAYIEIVKTTNELPYIVTKGDIE